jgi:anti-sigma B factor antagonist
MNATFLSTIVSGVPVVVTPEEIDITTAGPLLAALRDMTGRSPALVVVDMSGTRFCDSSAVHALLEAHQEARRDGVELRLVVPADGPLRRVMRLLGVDQIIPSSPGLAGALGREAPAAAGGR